MIVAACTKQNRCMFFLCVCVCVRVCIACILLWRGYPLTFVIVRGSFLDSSRVFGCECIHIYLLFLLANRIKLLIMGSSHLHVISSTVACSCREETSVTIGLDAEFDFVKRSTEACIVMYCVFASTFIDG